MKAKSRKIGIDIIGDAPWGTHFCQFYQTQEDLLDILVPYFKTGLENNESCIWITSDPLSEEEAKEAMRKVVPDFGQYLKRGQIEVIPHTEWYLKDGAFNSQRVLNGWVHKHNQALARGYDGLRLTGNTFWLEKKDWRDFTDYEEEVNRVIGQYQMIAICTYSLEKCGAAEVIDVVFNHQFALTQRESKWELIESSERKRVAEVLARAYAELEIQVEERTRELVKANEALQVEIAEHKRAEEQIKLRARQQAVVAELGQRVLAGADLSLLMDEAVAFVAQTLNVEYCKVLELLPDGNALLLRAGVGWKEGSVGHATVGAGADSQAGYTLRCNEPVIVEDLRSETRFSGPPLLHDHGVVSGMSVIIEGQDRPFGVLGAHTTRRQAFTQDDVHFLQAVANVLATAIERKWAEEELQKYYEHLEELVQARTAELKALNEQLQQEIIEHKRTEEALKQRTAELEAANKELEAFSYSISHDLRAPLRAIDGFSRILLEEHVPQLSPEGQRYLQLVRNSTQRMDRLIGDLLTFSRLSRQPLRVLPVLPADLVRQVLEDFRAEQARRRVEIAISDLPACQADPTFLRQVFLNLLSNAFKFTRQREVARIEVGCRHQGDEHIYFIKDNGVGFDMGYADKLFGAFQRLHRAEDYEGTGVGLAIVQRIIHRHGGRVWAEAEEDKGATFYFTLGGGSPHD